MRRVIVLPIAAALIAALAAPAGAETEHTDYESASANAFWYSRRVVEPGVVDRTTWYIGIYWSTDGIWSDVYKDTVRCRRLADGRRRCRLRSSLYGEITDLGDGRFEIDSEGLETAVLEATYPLRARDENYEPVGEVKPTRVLTTFEGVGDLQSDGGTYTQRTDCYYSRETYEYRSREAEAYGTVGTRNLGETYNAYLNWNYSDGMVNDRCEYEGEPEPSPRPVD